MSKKKKQLDRAHLDALPVLIQPLLAGRRHGMTPSQCSDTIYAWDQARKVKDAPQ